MSGTRWTREQAHGKGFRPDGKGGLARLPSEEWSAKHGPVSVMSDKPKPQIRIPRHRAPNKTEALWRNSARAADFPGCRFDYEAISFRLASGANYRPDWSIWQGNSLLACVEVKGGYSLHSHGRAALAFKTAANEWPKIRWIWAQWKGGEWLTTEIPSK